MCKETNKEIRSSAKAAGVLHWEIAERLGIQDSAFSRKLRRELPAQERDKILEIINELAAERVGVS